MVFGKIMVFEANKHHDISKHHIFFMEFGLNSEISKHYFGLRVHSSGQGMPESGSESHLEPEWESQRDRERQKKRLASQFYHLPKHCFVEKKLKKTLFCRDMSTYGIFVENC